jgi:hypothetical protein
MRWVAFHPEGEHDHDRVGRRAVGNGLLDRVHVVDHPGVLHVGQRGPVEDECSRLIRETLRIMPMFDPELGKTIEEADAGSSEM